MHCPSLVRVYCMHAWVRVCAYVSYCVARSAKSRAVAACERVPAGACESGWQKSPLMSRRLRERWWQSLGVGAVGCAGRAWRRPLPASRYRYRYHCGYVGPMATATCLALAEPGATACLVWLPAPPESRQRPAGRLRLRACPPGTHIPPEARKPPSLLVWPRLEFPPELGRPAALVPEGCVCILPGVGGVGGIESL